MSNSAQNRTFAVALKAARQGLGYTLADLADELGEGAAPTPLADLTAWEGGKAAPREWERPQVEAVERALGADGTLVDALGW